MARTLPFIIACLGMTCAALAEDKVAKPTLDPGADMTFSTDTLEVRCSCSEKDAEVRFTTDGKPVSAKITGVWLGKSGGVGTAVMKVNKVVTAFPVLVK